MKTRLVYNDKCKKSHTKPNQNQTKSSAQLELFSKEMLWMLSPHQKSIYFCYGLILINSIILELWKLIHFYILKKMKMGVLKIKFEILEMDFLKKIKIGILEILEVEF